MSEKLQLFLSRTKPAIRRHSRSYDKDCQCRNRQKEQNLVCIFYACCNAQAAVACSALILLASGGFCMAACVCLLVGARRLRRRTKTFAGCRARIPLRPLARDFLLFLGIKMARYERGLFTRFEFFIGFCRFGGHILQEFQKTKGPVLLDIDHLVCSADRFDVIFSIKTVGKVKGNRHQLKKR